MPPTPHNFTLVMPELDSFKCPLWKRAILFFCTPEPTPTPFVCPAQDPGTMGRYILQPCGMLLILLQQVVSYWNLGGEEYPSLWKALISLDLLCFPAPWNSWDLNMLIEYYLLYFILLKAIYVRGYYGGDYELYFLLGCRKSAIS
jgi:hypothetical protein